VIGALGAHGGPNQPVGVLPEHDLSLRGARLQPRGGAEHLAGGEPAVAADERLARLDADRQARRPQLERGSGGPQRVVLAHGGLAEHADQRVAGEGLDGPAVALDDRREAVELTVAGLRVEPGRVRS
jgi:hypothetical protein